MGMLTVLISLIVLGGIASSADARVVRFIVQQRQPFAAGRSFGTVGAYERLDGTAYFEVDPRDPLNAVIVNLDKAPRNSRGMVEFSAPFLMLKPLDVTRGNRKLFYTINNRGNAISIGRFNFARDTNNPLTSEDAGDGFLMRLGYTIVDAGWQGDVVPGNNRLFPSFPVPVQADGSPIVAPVRIEYSDRTIPRAGAFTLTLEGSPNFRSYETADTNTVHSTLSVQESVQGARVPILPDRWAFGTCSGGRDTLKPNTTNICLFDGFRSDKLYELTYPAKNPIVMGLGYAVTRDVASFLRSRTQDDAGNPNPLAAGLTEVGVRRAYSLGVSSTGMYQREFLYLGFNEDESHHKVFDALWASVPGTQRLFANVEFADPNTYSRQDDRHEFLSTSYPPFAFAMTRDPVSGRRDGILKRPTTDPLVIQTVTENEFWQFRAALDVVDVFGHAIATPRNVRLYLLSGFEHTGSLPAQGTATAGMCQNVRNQIYHGLTMRAVLVALDAWADRGVEPPKSNYPGIQDGTLVPVDVARKAFPAIPGVVFPATANDAEVLDYGPEFGSQGGRVTRVPPVIVARYKVLVPKPDRDGQDLAGIRPMEIRVPVGTHTGWNIRAQGSRAPDLCGLSGSFIPFARTKVERMKTGDPRPSLEERYHDHAGYVAAIRSAARALHDEGFLLEEDVDHVVREAEGSNILR
jgi:hypothetical protein